MWSARRPAISFAPGSKVGAAAARRWIARFSLLLGYLLTSSQALAVEAAAPHMVQNSLNLFRRFPPDLKPKMVAFYRDVLGLKPLQPITLTPSFQMILFEIGSGQVKLAAEIKAGRHQHRGEANDATGLRLIALRFPDEAALAARFEAAAYPRPQFKDRGDGTRTALVKDPGGFTLKLVVVPNLSPQASVGVEAGINVSDLARSRAFYRDFVGLEELPPVEDATLGVTKYRYRHGETTISLWSAGKRLPADTGSAGIQYVVSNLDAIDARAREHKVAVEQPLGDLPGFTLRTLWLNDPDGVTNYFAQVGAAAPSAAK